MSSEAHTKTPKPEGTPGLMPKRRCPGFSAPWALEPLSRVLTEHKIKNTAGRDVFSVSMESGIVNQIEHLGRSFAAADSSHYTIGRRFDVVYTKSPLKAFPFGVVKQCKFEGEVALSPLYGVFTPTNPHLGLMIEAYFEAPNRSKTFLSPLCQKGAKNTLQITNATFLSGRLPLPTQSAEQQKIAECLSSVDKLMVAQARKLDALKTHKKALMQELFPREGETQPRLRFPEFQNAGEWEEDKLIDIATFRRGSFPQPYGLPEWYDEVGGMPFVQVFDVGDDFRLKERTKSKISKLGAEKSVFIPKGTLIVTLQGSIGRVAITHYDAYIDRTLLIFETFRKPVEKVFFARLIQNLFDIEKEIAPGGIIKTITKEALSDFKVKLPKIPEQQRIADCLSSLDALITAQTQKLAALKTHKQALMQQLFPASEEVAA